MRNGGRVLLAFVNFVCRIKICVAPFDSNHSVTDSTQTINRCFSLEAFWFCSQVSYQSSPLNRVDVSGETIRLSISFRLAVDFLHVTYIQDKQMLVFDFEFDLLWTGVGSVAFFSVPWAKIYEKHGSKRLRTVLRLLEVPVPQRWKFSEIFARMNARYPILFLTYASKQTLSPSYELCGCGGSPECRLLKTRRARLNYGRRALSSKCLMGLFNILVAETTLVSSSHVCNHALAF